MKVQLVAIHDDGHTTVINDTNDATYLEQIAECRGGTIWLGSDLCDLRVQVIS